MFAVSQLSSREPGAFFWRGSTEGRDWHRGLASRRRHFPRDSVMRDPSFVFLAAQFWMCDVVAVALLSLKGSHHPAQRIALGPGHDVTPRRPFATRSPCATAFTMYRHVHDVPARSRCTGAFTMCRRVPDAPPHSRCATAFTMCWHVDDVPPSGKRATHYGVAMIAR
jgi:hypothetical protein